jgi:hypothetical protein
MMLLGETPNMVELTRYKKYKKTYQAYYQAHRPAYRAYYKAHRQKILGQIREWQKNHPEQERERRRKWRENNPKKKQAQNVISHGNRRGKIDYPLADACEFCGASGKLEHGHIDYDYPKIYLTVCRACNVWMNKPLEDS